MYLPHSSVQKYQKTKQETQALVAKAEKKSEQCMDLLKRGEKGSVAVSIIVCAKFDFNVWMVNC